MLAILTSLFLATAHANAPVLEVGTCTDGSVSVATAASAPANRIEVEFELESWVSGQFWDVDIYRNGSYVTTITRRTRGADGDFWIEGELRNRAGVDVFEFVATNQTTGEVCEAAVEWAH